jgi:hypothetical protein
MRKFVFCCGIAVGAVALAAINPAGAFMPNQTEIGTAALAISDVVDVKRSTAKPRPPGWSRGRKVGWGRGNVPPGQRR